MGRKNVKEWKKQRENKSSDKMFNENLSTTNYKLPETRVTKKKYIYMEKTLI